jgi:hypothetical protein
MAPIICNVNDLEDFAENDLYPTPAHLQSVLAFTSAGRGSWQHAPPFPSNTDRRTSCSYSGPSVAMERNARSVAYSPCIRLQW